MHEKTEDGSKKALKWVSKFFMWIWNYLLIPVLFSGQFIAMICGFVKQQFTVTTWVLLAISIAISIVFVIYIIKVRKERKMAKQEKQAEIDEKIKYYNSFECCEYDPQDIEPDFTIHDLQIDYRLTKKGGVYELCFTKTCTIEPMRDGLDSFYEQRKWTGNITGGSTAGLAPQITINGTATRVTKHPYRVGTADYYKITYPTGFFKNRKYEYESTNVISNTSNGLPFVALVTDHPTDKITFTIEIPRACKKRDVNVFVYRAGESSYELVSERKQIQNELGGLRFGKSNRAITFTIEHPKRFRYYLVSWEW